MSKVTDWEECVDEETGNTYWFSPSTEESSWDNPFEKSDEGQNDWQEEVDEDTKKKYYYSPSRKRSVWELPGNIISGEGLSEDAEETKTGDTANDISGDTDDEEEDDDWVVQHDDEGREYYYSERRQESRWDDPRKPTRKNKSEELNDDWEEHTTDDGERYWHSRSRGESTWNNPRKSTNSHHESSASSEKKGADKNGSDIPIPKTAMSSALQGALVKASLKRKEKIGQSDEVAEGVGTNAHPERMLSSDEDEEDVFEEESESAAHERDNSTLNKSGEETFGSSFGRTESNLSSSSEPFGSSIERRNTTIVHEKAVSMGDIDLTKDPLIQGYLLKQGGGRRWFGRKNWKKRWFVAYGPYFALWKNREEFDRKDIPPIKNRWVNAENFRCEKHMQDRLGIRLVPCNSDYSRVWYFRTEDSGARDLWFCAFSKICSVGFMADLQKSLVGGLGKKITSSALLKANKEGQGTRKSHGGSFSFD